MIKEIIQEHFLELKDISFHTEKIHWVFSIVDEIDLPKAQSSWDFKTVETKKILSFQKGNKQTKTCYIKGIGIASDSPTHQKLEGNGGSAFNIL